MSLNTAHHVTQLLAALGHGDLSARDKLLQAVYEELHRMARAQMAREAPGRTLQPTALVHEAYLRLFPKCSATATGDDAGFTNRRHFFGAAARAMQQIRVDDARKRGRLKRGGKEHRMEAYAMPPPVFEQDPAEVLALDEAMAGLQEQHPELAEVVRLRYFVGLSLDETAEVIAVAPRTVGNRWRLARAWLYDALSETGASTNALRVDDDDRTITSD